MLPPLLLLAVSLSLSKARDITRLLMLLMLLLLLLLLTLPPPLLLMLLRDEKGDAVNEGGIGGRA